MSFSSIKLNKFSTTLLVASPDGTSIKIFLGFGMLLTNSSKSVKPEIFLDESFEMSWLILFWDFSIVCILNVISNAIAEGLEERGIDQEAKANEKKEKAKKITEEK